MKIKSTFALALITTFIISTNSSASGASGDQEPPQSEIDVPDNYNVNTGQYTQPKDISDLQDTEEEQIIVINQNNSKFDSSSSSWHPTDMRMLLITLGTE